MDDFNFIFVHSIFTCIMVLLPSNILLTFRPFLQGADGIFIGDILSVSCFKGLIYENSKLWKSSLLPFVSALIIFWVYYCIHRRLMGVILLPSGSLISDLSICILILVSILHLDGIIYKILNIKILISIGIISYSLYIWHNLLILPRDYKWKCYLGYQYHLTSY